MLGLFSLLMISAMLMGTLKDPDHLSYIAAFIMALVLTAGLLRFKRRRTAPSRVKRTADPVKIGALLGLLCFVVNLIWVLAVRLEPTVDYLTFWTASVELAEGKALSGARFMALFPHILGYSTFLSCFIRAFGPSPLLAPVINVILTVMSGAIIYTLCLRWRGLNTAAAASLLWTFCPSKMLYNTMVLSEPLYTFLMLLFILLVSSLERKTGRRYWVFILAAVCCAMTLAMANAARPVALVPMIAFGIWLCLLRGERMKEGTQCRRWLAFTGVLLVCYGLFGAGWRNHAEKVLGQEAAWTPGYSMYVGFNPESGGSYSDEDIQLLYHYSDLPGYSAADAQTQMFKLAKERASSNSVNLGRLLLTKIRTFLGNDEGGAYYSKAALSDRAYSVCAVVSNIYYYTLVLLVLHGVRNIRRDKIKTSLLIVPMYVLGLTLAQMLVEVAGRYHYSIIPMLVIMAAFSCTERYAANHDMPDSV